MAPLASDCTRVGDVRQKVWMRRYRRVGALCPVLDVSPALWKVFNTNILTWVCVGYWVHGVFRFCILSANQGCLELERWGGCCICMVTMVFLAMNHCFCQHWWWDRSILSQKERWVLWVKGVSLKVYYQLYISGFSMHMRLKSIEHMVNRLLHMQYFLL